MASNSVSSESVSTNTTALGKRTATGAKVSKASLLAIVRFIEGDLADLYPTLSLLSLAPRLQLSNLLFYFE